MPDMPQPIRLRGSIGFDPSAPGYEPEAEGLAWYRRAWRQGLLWFLPSSVFLAFPFIFGITENPPSVWVPLVALALIVGVLYLGATLIMSWALWRRVLWTTALSVAIILMGVVGGSTTRFTYFAPYATCVTVVLLPWPIAWPALLAVTAAAFGYNLVVGDMFGMIMAVMAGVVGFSIGQGIESGRRGRLLRQEQERSAVLAVVAERERIGRDLHDILGHSLTTVAIKADLASRLVDRDPAAARGQIDEVATIARQALADVRATASGMRQVRLASEIASGRSVLAAAEVAAEVPTALPVLSDERAELFGYVVREAITNVVRHAAARRCTIAVDGDRVEVSDDGRGMAGGDQGSGLRGLRERVEAAGGRLLVTSGRGGTSIRAEMGDS